MKKHIQDKHPVLGVSLCYATRKPTWSSVRFWEYRERPKKTKPMKNQPHTNLLHNRVFTRRIFCQNACMHACMLSLPSGLPPVSSYPQAKGWWCWWACRLVGLMGGNSPRKCTTSCLRARFLACDNTFSFLFFFKKKKKGLSLCSETWPIIDARVGSGLDDTLYWLTRTVASFEKSSREQSQREKRNTDTRASLIFQRPSSFPGPAPGLAPPPSLHAPPPPARAVTLLN